MVVAAIIAIFGLLILTTRRRDVQARPNDSHGRPNAQVFAEALESQPNQAAPQPVTEQTKPVPAPTPTRPFWDDPQSPLRHWALPKPPTVTQGNKVVDLVVNEWGTVAVVKTEKEVYCFHLISGLVLQTYKPAISQYNKDPNADRIFLSPKGKYVATWAAGESSKKPDATVTFQDAESGRIVSTATLEHDAQVEFDPATFTPQETAFLLPGRFHGKPCIQVISVASGMHKFVNFPPTSVPNGILKMLIPLPGRAAFLTYWSNDRITNRHPSRASISDLQNWSERPLASIDIEPFFSFYDRRAIVSPDGSLALSLDILRHGQAHFELSDLRIDTVQIKHPESDASFCLPRFTPDGKRFVVEWCPNYKIMHFGAAPNVSGTESVPCKLQLYDVVSQKKIGEFTPQPAYAETLAFSGDGKKLVYSHGMHLFAIDFQSAFNVEPLAPLGAVQEAILTSR